MPNTTPPEQQWPYDPDPPHDADAPDVPTSTLDRHTDLDELRDGGPTRTPGAMTTTGGTAGPASTGRRFTPGAAPTTTGDAGSGGTDAPIGGGYSDATTRGATTQAAAGTTPAEAAPSPRDVARARRELDERGPEAIGRTDISPG